MVEISWMEKHQAIFGCWGDGWSITYPLWDQMLRGEGWPEAWLSVAVERVAMRDTLPKFAPDHLQALKEELLAMRRAERRARETQRAALPVPDAKSICTNCRESGWVCGLPHVQSLDEYGEWVPPRYTMACPCNCWIGRKVHGAFRVNDQAVMSLEEYTRRNPNWKSQLAREEDRRRAEREASRAAGGLQGVNRTREAVQQALANLKEKAGVAG